MLTRLFPNKMVPINLPFQQSIDNGGPGIISVFESMDQRRDTAVKAVLSETNRKS